MIIPVKCIIPLMPANKVPSKVCSNWYKQVDEISSHINPSDWDELFHCTKPNVDYTSHVAMNETTLSSWILQIKRLKP